MPKANEVGNVKTEMVGLSWKRKEKLRERQLISSRQRAVGVLLIVLGVLVFAVGLFGYLAGDLQLSSLSWLSDQVYAAREAAQSAGTAVTGAFDLYGEDSGVRVFYATYAAGEESGAISAQDFELGEDKGSLKGEGLQFPGTKDYKNLVIAEETPVTLDNGMEFTQSVKLRGAGSSKYRSLKLTVEAPGTLTVYALSSLADQERQLVLYNTRNGAEVSTAMAPASAEGALTPLTFEIPEAGTFYLSSKGDVPIAPMSTLMNIAIILLLVGVIMLFNGVMLLIQRMERMKDLFCVEPALLFFLLFVYYPVIDLVRISFTDMGILTTGKQEFVGWDNYNWLFNQSGSRYFWESLRITGIYTFWEVMITLVGGMLLALLFNRMTRSFNVMRSIAFMPKYIAVSTSAVVFMWILYSPAATGASQSEGILNYALSLFGITGPHWLIDASTALTGILFLTAWRVVGYAMMIYLSAMKGIPQDYYEAAVIDGADGVQRFRYITVPLLAPTSLFLFVTTFIASMKVFQSVDVMTGGGPGTATNVMVQWIYNLTFKDFRTARGAAVSLVFFVILLVCTVATMRFSNKNVNYDA